jgi:murein DD-endopeptidase MepM/ murein hydrolase activator NlpD
MRTAVKSGFTVPANIFKRIHMREVLACFVFTALLIWSALATGSFLAARDVIASQQMRIAAPLKAQINELESRIATLQETNNSIIARVRETALSDVAMLESVIKKTGLQPETLKKQYSERTGGKRKAEGGPFVPANSLSFEEQEVYSNLDDVSHLRSIVEQLPLASPIKNASMQSPFGRRFDPFNGRLAIHTGIDLAAAEGAAIYATASGKVSFAGYSGAYGNVVDLDHAFGLSTRYGHLSQIRVNAGQFVTKGQIIGVQGRSGRATGAHLHYEVRRDNQPVNPKNFLQAFASSNTK